MPVANRALTFGALRDAAVMAMATYTIEQQIHTKPLGMTEEQLANRATVLRLSAKLMESEVIRLVNEVVTRWRT